MNVSSLTRLEKDKFHGGNSGALCMQIGAICISKWLSDI